jgi:hypothetical protein
MTHWHESLDECIDRVAGSMTLVPAEVTVRARVSDRIDRLEAGGARRRPTRHSISLGLGAAAAIVAILWLSRPSEEMRRTESATRSDIELAAAPEAAPMVPDAHEASQRSARADDGVARGTVHGVSSGDESRELPALSAPPTIDTDALYLQPLTLEPVYVDPLTMPNLTGAGWITMPESKE